MTNNNKKVLLMVLRYCPGSTVTRYPVDRRVCSTAGGDRLPSSAPPPPKSPLSLPSTSSSTLSSPTTLSLAPSISPTFILAPTSPFPNTSKFSLINSPLPFSSASISFPSLKQTLPARPTSSFVSTRRCTASRRRKNCPTFASSLFSHPSAPTKLPLPVSSSMSLALSFSSYLAVDDFGVKYSLRSDIEFLVSCLSILYHAKAHSIASKFLGFSVSHNRTARTFTISYRAVRLWETASHLLARLRSLGVSPAIPPPSTPLPSSDPGLPVPHWA